MAENKENTSSNQFVSEPSSLLKPKNQFNKKQDDIFGEDDCAVIPEGYKEDRRVI